MAKRRTSGRAPAKKDRAPKAKSKKKPAPTTEMEVVEEAAGEGIDTGVAVMTTLLLLAGILFLDKLRGMFDTGMFF